MCRSLEFAWIAVLVRRQIAFEVDDFAHSR
jgi:hypothetical protein